MTPAMITACERYIGQDLVGLGAPVFFKGQDIPSGVSVYVRFFVVPSDETLPIGMGETAKKRNVGLVQASVYGPRGKGGGPTGAIAHAIWKHFTRKQREVPGEGAVTFKEGSVLDMDTVGEEYLHIVRVPYRYDFQI